MCKRQRHAFKYNIYTLSYINPCHPTIYARSVELIEKDKLSHLFEKSKFIIQHSPNEREECPIYYKYMYNSQKI